MSLNRLYVLLPSRRTLFTVVLSSAVGAGLVIATAVLLDIPLKPAPGPVAPRDVRFVALGKAYLPQLGRAYAAAWEEGVKQLEAGKDISAAIDSVAKSWSSNRAQLYDHVLTPEFSKIVVESVKDSEVTPAERSAMVAAWRGLAVGLAK
jgi:hypothetical protein